MADPVEVRVVRPDALGPDDLARWEGFQAADAALAGPFLTPGFTRLVAAARDDVHVAVLEQDGEDVGYLPFQRGRMGVGHPVGWTISDQQAVVARPDVTWRAEDLVRACGLRAWRFDHLLTHQAPFAAHHQRRHRSPVVDLASGYEAYAGDVSGGLVKATERKLRKLAREHGEVTFEAEDGDPAALATLLAWKSAQYTRTGAADVFSRPWVRQVVAAAHATRTPGFAGVLSTLSVDGRLVAAHLGIRSATVLHWWFPVYDTELGAYSPGLILLLKMAEAAPGLGVSLIDLGKGEAQYKERAATGAVEVAEGMVTASAGVGAAVRLGRSAREAARRSGIGPPLRRLVRGIARRR